MIFNVKLSGVGEAPELPFPVGSQVILDTVGEDSWVCPASGNWEAEIHGGGMYGTDGLGLYWNGAGGGGSGQMVPIQLIKGVAYTYQIGEGGSNSSRTPGRDSFLIVDGVNLSCKGASDQNASGKLATSGDGQQGGLGNKDKPQQPYGNGGAGGSAGGRGYDGNDGAIILTYLG